MTLDQADEPLSGQVTATSSAISGSGPVIAEEVAARIAAAVQRSRAESTRRGYASDWARFVTWCFSRGHIALPAHPMVVAAYLVDAADTLTEDGQRAYAPATLSRWVAALGHHHRRAGHGAPGHHEMVAATLSGIRRDYAASGQRPRRQAAPLLVDDVVALVTAAREAVTGWASEVLERRDTALLLLGFAGAFRRGELADLVCSDVSMHRLDGLHVRLRRSKTDQEGEGAVRAVPCTTNHHRCPPCAFVRWVQVVAAYDTAGRPGVIRLLRNAPAFETHVCRGAVPRTRARASLFRSVRKNGNISDGGLTGAAVHGVIRRRAAEAGYDPVVVAQLGGHSLRAGFVTQAVRNGKDAHAIMRQTGHTTAAMIEVYARENAPLVANAVTDIGL
ncbi:site-specific integrase [Rhodococcus marinonascens]|uniref:site-specific integrase n=1 Tax=Rhodococcus marinonascens TaxID=38311 RepID=UPI000934D8EE|nr:site-specific integrase [Rhodococcus marinonascens]